jgi:hypothetical protein
MKMRPKILHYIAFNNTVLCIEPYIRHSKFDTFDDTDTDELWLIVRLFASTLSHFSIGSFDFDFAGYRSGQQMVCLFLLTCSVAFAVVSANTTFDILNERSYKVYEQNSVDIINRSFSCLNPNALLYGGFGNLMFTMLSAQLVAILTERVMVMNHRLLLEMFDHPDPKETWNLVPVSKFAGLKQMVGTRPDRCADVVHQAFSAMPLKYGTNGCTYAYVMHSESATVLQQLIPPRFPANEVPVHDQWIATIARWMLSRPTAQWRQIVDDYAKEVFAPCGNDIKHADLAVQLRTWRDVNQNTNFHQVGGVCHETCAREAAKDIQSRLGRPICVFITSDNATSSALLVDSLNEMSPGNIHAVHSADTSLTAWHTFEVVESGRWDGPAYDPAQLVHQQALKDWMLLSEASEALYTPSSTFGATARLRAGPHAQLYDRVSTIDAAKECVCSAVLPHFPLGNHTQLREETIRRLRQSALF